jgi:hypothetical protein
MAEETGVPSPTIEGNMLFYKQPELLNVQAHGKLGITPQKEQPFAFLRETQIVPITVAEFGHAALNYPIVFAGEEKTPAAVMGMKQDHNAFVDDEGKLLDGVYVPAFIRRYPFASAKNAQDENNLMICIDRSSAMITENPEVPFFQGEALTEMTSQAVEFVKAYEAETIGTANFIRVMNELDLFSTQDVVVAGPPGNEGDSNQHKMGNYIGISEEKMAALPADKLVELRDNGGLAAIYAHRLSHANWQRLLNMEMARDMKDQQAGGQA